MKDYKENPDYIKLYKLEDKLINNNLKYNKIEELDYEQFKILSKYYDKYCEFVKNTFKDIVKKYGNIVDEEEFLTKMQVVKSYDKSENNTFQFFADAPKPYIEFSTIFNSQTYYIVLSIELLFDENLIKKKIFETINQIYYKYNDKISNIDKQIYELKQKRINLVHQQIICAMFFEENEYKHEF